MRFFRLKSRSGIAVTAVALGVAASLAGPTAANAEASGTTDEVTHAEITVQMVPTCDEGHPNCDLSGFSPTRPGGVTTQGAVAGNCGTSTIYVDKIGTHKGRVSWGMFAATGHMVARELTITWGPAGGGSFLDLSPMNSEDYTKSRTVSGTGNLSATIGGSVQLVGSKYVHCVIPTHGTNPVRI